MIMMERDTQKSYNFFQETTRWLKESAGLVKSIIYTFSDLRFFISFSKKANNLPF